MTSSTVLTKIAVVATLASMGLAQPSARPHDPSAEGPGQRADDGPGGKPGGPRDVLWNIRGTVVDEQGRPVAGAVVHVSGPTFETGAASGVADAEGAFVLELGDRRPAVQ